MPSGQLGVHDRFATEGGLAKPRLFPVVVGGGKRALPDDVRAQLELLDERRFGSGVVHLHYRVCV